MFKFTLITLTCLLGSPLISSPKRFDWALTVIEPGFEKKVYRVPEKKYSVSLPNAGGVTCLVQKAKVKKDGSSYSETRDLSCLVKGADTSFKTSLTCPLLPQFFSESEIVMTKGNTVTTAILSCKSKT